MVISFPQDPNAAARMFHGLPDRPTLRRSPNCPTLHPLPPSSYLVFSPSPNHPPHDGDA